MKRTGKILALFLTDLMLCAYERYDETARIRIALNAQDSPADGSELAAGGEILLSQGFDAQSLAPFGCKRNREKTRKTLQFRVPFLTACRSERTCIERLL